jgi:hypothetical protein
MPSKKYVAVDGENPKNPSIVSEATARTYAREKKSISLMASNIASVKRRLKKPIKRSKKQIAWALEIAGIGEGPADLSEKTREYLYRNE